MGNQIIQNGRSLTFMDIISQHRVEIPVIQRDYAQGRKSNRVDPIRKKFVKELIESIKDNSEPMHLDFIYGRIDSKNQKLIFEKNKEAIENILLAVKGYADQCNIDFDPKINIPNTINESNNSKFIPLDGQQRLTTLYLLHWYILKRIKFENKEKILFQLKGFSYKTRNSTKEFCEFLIKTASHLDFENDKPISKVITESLAFLDIWEKDPSVQGMLTMLDEIDTLLKQEDDASFSAYWKNLENGRRLTFDFLDLDEYEQTDELYVKMNARGKQLTDFEHFKSWLHEYIKSNKLKILEEKWSDCIDTKWLDLFWKNKPENIFNVDATIYNCIKSINLYEYIAITKKELSVEDEQNETIINRDLIRKINEKNEDKNFISIAEYEESGFFSYKSLNFTFSSLNKLSSINLTELHKILKEITAFPFMEKQNKEDKLPFIYLSENQNPSLPERVFYYSFLLFINQDSIELTKSETLENLKNWMRICRNIIFNTYIQNPDNFIDAIKAIKDFSAYMNNIENEITQQNFSVKFFDSQLKEEIKKIQYFNKGENWKNKIIEVENHPYFYGQINFIFHLIDHTDDFQKFDFYCNILSKIFNAPEANNYLFQRLLLSKGDYLIKYNSKWSLCESKMIGLRARQDNWRKVFNDEKKLFYLKAVLDDAINLGLSESSLNNYENKNWTSFFIKEKYSSNIAYTHNRLIERNNGWDIKLLEKSTFTGKHADLYSHSLYLDLKYEGFDVSYESVNGRRSATNKPKINLSIAGETIFIFYEPYYYDNCAFEIEHKSIIFKNVDLFDKSSDKLVFKMSRDSVAEDYNRGLEAIVNLFKSI